MKPFLNTFRQIYLAQSIDMYTAKYMPNGLKPVEAFYSDISNNLVKWAAKGDATYYETKKYWYCFKLENTSRFDTNFGIIWMRRFNINSSSEICDFANKHSVVGLGKKWLFCLKDKRVSVE